jgi:hypothetical protein
MDLFNGTSLDELLYVSWHSKCKKYEVQEIKFFRNLIDG